MVSVALGSELAPTGRLRVGINYGNPVLATRNASSGELRGVAVDLARELGRRTALPIEIVAFESAGKMFDAVKAGAWDVAFLAVDPGRASEIDFTAPYVEIEGTYLIPSGAPFSNVADVDRDGVRVGVSAKSAYDLFLSRTLKHAQIVRAQSPESAFDLILSSKVDVLAGVRQTLVAYAPKLPGSRLFEDRFMAIGQAMGIVKGRGEAVKYLREFVEDVKASGFVARAIEKNSVRGVSIPASGM
ncbi:MAG TPA: ABC transporter substrate-binding protein [Candidatus Limnocylindrales bacterium]|nr:ABC transporter substrate-binding protein [Candidatus Limnocylindrales bacterium]